MAKMIDKQITGRIQRLLKSYLIQFRDWYEDAFPSEALPRITMRDFQARFRVERRVWDEYEIEFEGEVAYATRLDAEFLFSFLERLQPKTLLEIGTWKGGTAALAKTICPLAEVFTINHPEPQHMNNPLTREDIGNAFRRRNIDVNLVWADSANLLELQLPTFEAIFVDGDHGYSAVMRDLSNAWILLRPGGYLLFHDFIQSGIPDRPPHTRQVFRAFCGFSKKHRAEIVDGFQVEGTWIGVVQKRFSNN